MCFLASALSALAKDKARTAEIIDGREALSVQGEQEMPDAWWPAAENNDIFFKRNTAIL